MGSTLKALLCTLLFALPIGSAQYFYVGATVGTPLSLPASPVDYAELGAQFGFDPLPGFGVRVSAEGNPLNGGFKLASADAIFRFFLPFSATSLYTGLGADAFYTTQPSSLSELRNARLVAHVPLGAEFRLGSFGFFGELLPSYFVGSSLTSRNAYYLRLRGGVNFHFF